MEQKLAELAPVLEKQAKPLLDKLEKSGMKREASEILDLIKLISIKPLDGCESLYLLLQSEIFNEIEDDVQDKNQEVAESLTVLFNLTGAVFNGLIDQALEMLAEHSDEQI